MDSYLVEYKMVSSGQLRFWRVKADSVEEAEAKFRRAWVGNYVIVKVWL